MKPSIHPTVQTVAFQDRTTGKVFLVKSTLTPSTTIEHQGQTYPLIVVDVSSDSHPLWTGKVTPIDTEGRVAAFNRRYANKN